MAAARKRSVPYDRQVFLNCPFDDDYYPLLRAAVFTIQACGFTARIALENTGSESVRLDRLVRMIGQCGLGIHDLSRVRLTSPTDLPRFNMPFECGVFYGARRFGAKAQRRKRFLLLDQEPFQYQKTMSDVAGLDPRAHGNDPEKLIACIRDFLAEGLDPMPMGPTRISALYREFLLALPSLTANAEVTLAEIEPLSAFNDWYLFASRWLLREASTSK
jgi:hypothetical protein